MARKRHAARRPVPLTVPPTSLAMRSRKRARRATTLFHNLTREKDAALERGDDPSVIQEWDEKIREMGGREEYQRASQLNTSLFSTSRWVLGVLGRWGWLNGLPIEDGREGNAAAKEGAEEGRNAGGGGKIPKDQGGLEKGAGSAVEEDTKRRKRKRVERRDVRLMEVGAINAQLLDASSMTKGVRAEHSSAEQSGEIKAAVRGKTPHQQSLYRLNVRAIDLRSTHPQIEQADFLQMPFEHPVDPARRYDVIVCSMVINCVTTPVNRGTMLCLLYHRLRPGGVCFLTLPRLCLMQSKYMTVRLFQELLAEDGVGFKVLETKDSPKIAFFVLKRPEEGRKDGQLDERFAQAPVIKKGNKFRNNFSVTLNADEVLGSAF